MSERGVCHVCEQQVPLDGEQAIERFGEVLCRNCSDDPVVFEVSCENEFCDWSFRIDETEFNRGHAKQRAQNEANQHEKRKRIFDDDPMHNTDVEEVDAA